MADDKSAAQNIAGKTGNFYEKHKTSIWIGAAILGILIIWLIMRGSSNSASNTGTAANVSPDSSNLGPSLGSGSFGAGGFNGAPGPAGPAGATGATGPKGATGATGKTPSLWQIAKEALEGKGIRNPTSSQIWHERKTLFGIGGGKKKIARRPGPVKPPKVTPAHQLASVTQYTHVANGQTSASVAAKHGMTTSSLHALNPGLGSTGAMPGQRVRIK